MTRYFVDVGDETFEVDVSSEGVAVNGEPVEADWVEVAGTGASSLVLDGASHRVLAVPGEQGRWELRIDGVHHRVRAVNERTRRVEEMTGGADGARGPDAVRAPMPGLVVRIDVAEGDVIEPGQGVVIVEAMKMENELKADAAAVVAAVRVDVGQAVEKDQILIDLEAADEGDG